MNWQLTVAGHVLIGKHMYNLQERQNVPKVPKWNKR